MINKVIEGHVVKPYYENYLLKEALKNQETRGFKNFHPSGFGGCLRKMALQFYGESDKRFKEPLEHDPKSERIFRAGHAYHYRMQSELADMGILKGYWRSKITGKVYGKDSITGIFRPESPEAVGETRDPDDKRTASQIFEYEEIRLYDDTYNFAGHCDGVIHLDKDNPETMYVIDFKSIKFEKFEILSKTKKPDTGYITQINIYMWLLGIKKGIIFYEDKNTHQVKEFEIFYDEELIEGIKENALKLKKILKNNQLPKIPDHYEKDKKPCMYCGYKDVCWKNK